MLALIFAYVLHNAGDFVARTGGPGNGPGVNVHPYPLPLLVEHTASDRYALTGRFQKTVKSSPDSLTILREDILVQILIHHFFGCPAEQFGACRGRIRKQTTATHDKH